MIPDQNNAGTEIQLLYLLQALPLHKTSERDTTFYFLKI